MLGRHQGRGDGELEVWRKTLESVGRCGAGETLPQGEGRVLRVYQPARRGGGRKGQEGPTRSTAFWRAAGHVYGGAEDFVTVIYARAGSSSVAIACRHKVDSIAPLLHSAGRHNIRGTFCTTSQRMKRWTRVVLPASARKKHRKPCRQRLSCVAVRQRDQRTFSARCVE